MMTEEVRIKCFVFENQFGGYLPKVFSTIYLISKPFKYITRGKMHL